MLQPKRQHHQRLGLYGAILGLVLGIAPARAQPVDRYIAVGVYPFKALGYCQLTSLTSAVSATSCSGGIPVGADLMQICVETQAIRYRDDGTAPTAAIGMPVASATCFQYSGSSLSALQFIQQTANATVDISFYK